MHPASRSSEVEASPHRPLGSRMHPSSPHRVLSQLQSCARSCGVAALRSSRGSAAAQGVPRKTARTTATAMRRPRNRAMVGSFRDSRLRGALHGCPGRLLLPMVPVQVLDQSRPEPLAPDIFAGGIAMKSLADPRDSSLVASLLVKVIHRKRGGTLEEVARSLGLSEKTLRRWARGSHGASPKHLDLLARE